MSRGARLLLSHLLSLLHRTELVEGKEALLELRVVGRGARRRLALARPAARAASPTAAQCLAFLCGHHLEG